MIGGEHDTIVSLPMYCQMGGISLNEIDYEQINIRLKPEYNDREWIRDDFFRNYQQAINTFDSITPGEDLTYHNHINFRSWVVNDEQFFEEKVRSMDKIFSAIVAISMILCFFSLSSSMTANIYDQSREISVMCSFGCKKSTLLRIFIYESLVLVVSSSIGGFIIGIFIGNLMTMQQAML
jgi:ABC-type antimicrobial peptide transport system permease subunit